MISSGGLATGTIVSARGAGAGYALQILDSGGKAYATLLVAGYGYDVARQFINSSGLASGTTISAGGVEIISAGGVAI